MKYMLYYEGVFSRVCCSKDAECMQCLCTAGPTHLLQVSYDLLVLDHTSDDHCPDPEDPYANSHLGYFCLMHIPSRRTARKLMIAQG